MINVIIPPIIILFIIAVLIVLFAKASRDAQQAQARQDASVPSSTHKQKHTQTHFQKWKKSIEHFLKRTAYRRSKKAVLHENSAAEYTHKTTPGQGEMGKIQQNNQNNQHKLSRMGELILSYHKGDIDEDSFSEQDVQEAELVKYIEANPKNPDAYQKLGDYYMEMHKFEDARESYKYVLRINPRHKRAQEAMKNLDRVLG